jgi:hypothetical protein
MKKLMQRGAYALGALLTVFAVGFATVQAQTKQGNGFQISPVRYAPTIEKGKSDTGLTISVTNPSDAPLVAQPVVNDFIASDDESGEPRLILDDSVPAPKNSFKKLVGPLASLNLGPKEKKDIQVTISVPNDATAGGYYGVIRFVPQLTSGNQNATNVGLTASVGTVVLVRVPGNLKERLDLVQLSAATKTGTGENAYKAKSFFTSGDVAIMTRLKNSGDIHLQPFGRVTVKNMFGKKVQEFELNSTSGNTERGSILPDSTRKFTNDLQKIKWFGRYTIEANLGYGGGGGGVLSAKASFWYIPTLVLYAIILVILLIVGAVYWLIRKQKARKQHKHDVNKVKL